MTDKALTRRVTSVDVARRAGVNQSTVSRVLAGDAGTEETRKKVLAAVHALGYTPNALARSLITNQTNLVAVVAASFESPFQSYVLERIIRALQATGRRSLVFTAEPEQEVDDVLPLALQYRADAVIVTSATLSSACIAACVREGTPLILFNRTMPGEEVDAVCCDNLAAGVVVADRLLAAGHVRFAYIAGSINSSTNRDRERGFTERLRAQGIEAMLRGQARYNYESGVAAGRELLARDHPPDAIFCGSDIIALGVLDAARNAGVRVPTDLSVVGFDDIPMASWTAYALTTIRQPVDAMIAATISVLDERTKWPAMPPAGRLFPGTLIERGSIRPLDR